MEVSFFDVFRLNNPNIIDIRSGFKYNDNHVTGSVNVPYDILIGNPDKYLNKSEVYYVYCQKGITSRLCMQILRSLGYNVISIKGGYEEYILNY